MLYTLWRTFITQEIKKKYIGKKKNFTEFFKDHEYILKMFLTHCILVKIPNIFF